MYYPYENDQFDLLLIFYLFRNHPYHFDENSCRLLRIIEVFLA